MTLKELATQAIKAINETPKPIEPKITLIIPGVWRKSNKRRLCNGGPVGDIVEETTNGLTVIFDAVDVLAFCAAKGVVNLRPHTLPSNKRIS